MYVYDWDNQITYVIFWMWCSLVPVCTPVYYRKDTKCVATVIFETVWSLESFIHYFLMLLNTD